MKRILVYGGCHAIVIRDMLQGMLPANAATFSVMINFQLIATNKPFPYEQLGDFDIVVYSPIENKDAYNTSFLERECRQAGIETICFPWLEWHGYTPGAFKGMFAGEHQWYLPALEQIASAFTDFNSFRKHVISSYPSDEMLTTSIERTTSMLRSQEQRNTTNVSVTEFVQKEFRRSRLFLVPDHPSQRLYEHVVLQVARLLGFENQADCSTSCAEPHPESRIPIMPKVARFLELEFYDPTWNDAGRMPGVIADLDAYLMQYFFRPTVLIAPLPEVKYPGEIEEVPLNTRVLAQHIDKDAPGPMRYHILRPLSGRPPVATHVVVSDQHWRKA